MWWLEGDFELLVGGLLGGVEVQRTKSAVPARFHLLAQATAQPGEWGKLDAEREHVTYYTSLFVSHIQTSKMTQAYFDHVERHCARRGMILTQAGPLRFAHLS